MIPTELIADINQVQTKFIQAVDLLEKSGSIRSLPESAELRVALRKARGIAAHPLVGQPCDGRIVCAFIGSSGHGKTTFLNELFPDLGRRGWLVIESTDTTAQSLRIEYADKPNELGRVVVNSFSYEQIKKLVESSAASEQNKLANIEVRPNDEEKIVVVDGTREDLTKSVLDPFQFALRQELRPLSQPYTVPADKLEDTEFIRALTIKELPGRLSTGPVLTLDGQAFNALQLRAIVKDVTLHDSYERLVALSGRARDVFASLVFVDTPGLATESRFQDEVLRHCLIQKSNRIAIELWKEGELDIIVHLVLCGQQSHFATLWKAIEEECGTDAVRDLEERVILLVNGVKIYFENPELNKYFKEPAQGDHFAVTLVDDILQKMNPRGQFRPAEICFADSRRVVEGGSNSSSYEDQYKVFRNAMLRWVEPGGAGRETLDQLGLTNDFRENIDSLCDPEDRGQGFLIKKVLDLVETKGPGLLFKKHLVRTGLRDVVRELRTFLAEYYGADGTLSRKAIARTLGNCLGFLGPDDPQALEEFVTANVDPDIESLFNGQNGDVSAGHWVEASFRRMTERVCDGILCRPNVNLSVGKAFRDYFGKLVDTWAVRWGYVSASLEPPSHSPAAGELIKHCLKFHAREVVYQLLEEVLSDARGAAFEKDKDDQKQVIQAVTLLNEAAQLADKWYPEARRS